MIGDRHVQCEGKTPWPTWFRAHRHLLARRREGRFRQGDRRLKLVIYRCPWCCRFHIGNGVYRRSA